MSDVKIADFVLIPVQPSPYDIWASFVISRMIKNNQLEVIEALKPLWIPTFNSYTTQRVIYSTLASQGQTVYMSVFIMRCIIDDSIRNEIIEVLQWL